MERDPASAGLDPERLERITEHLLRSYIEPGKIAGCQVMVARHGRGAYFCSLGTMDADRTRPVRDDTMWRIYSMTKPITSVALMTLYERGLFQLTDPVQRFLPRWRDMKVCQVHADGSSTLIDAARPMTVRDLLMHTSGLTYATDANHPVSKLYQEAGIRDRDISLEAFADRLSQLPLMFHPGTRWHYSFATDVCGHLVELLSGRSLDDYLQREIFEPLGMSDTGFVVPHEQADRLAANFRRTSDKKLELVTEAGRDWRQPPKFLSGGGGLVSTTGDYMKFCQMLLGGGALDGARVLGRVTVDLMRQNHLPGGCDIGAMALGSFGETRFDGVGFGLGFAVGLGPVRSGTIGPPGDYYWGGAASTIFWVDPSEDLAVIFMTQLMPSGTFNFRGQLKTLVYPAIV